MRFQIHNGSSSSSPEIPAGLRHGQGQWLARPGQGQWLTHSNSLKRRLPGSAPRGADHWRGTTSCPFQFCPFPGSGVPDGGEHLRFRRVLIRSLS